MGIKYRDNMSPQEMCEFLAEIGALEQAYLSMDAVSFWRELGLAFFLAAQWEIDNEGCGQPREEWDTEEYRRSFVDDMVMASQYDEFLSGALDHRGRP